MTIAQLASSPAHAKNRWDVDASASTVEQRILPMEEVPANFSFQEDFDYEVDYDQTRFRVEGDLAVYVANPQKSPIRLGYRDEFGTLEVIDWGIEVPLEQSGELPRLIGRRFLELYSKAITGSLHPDERAWLRKISEQMDYHSFAAARQLPRYREATLVRKEPVLLVQFIEEKNIKLSSQLGAKVAALDAGDRFGAWFTLDEKGEIVDFQHILLLPPLDEALANLCESSPGVELSSSLNALLPKAR